MQIKLHYLSSDGRRKSGIFKTLKGAQAFAQKWVGKYPEHGTIHQYAVSGDGVGRITWEGCTFEDLFPADSIDAYYVLSDEDGRIIEVYASPCDEPPAAACAAQRAGLVLHHIIGNCPTVGGTISMKGARR